MRYAHLVMLCILVVICAASVPSFGYVQLWYQPPHTGQNADISDFAWNQQVADDFLFDNVQTVTSVRWWGAYGHDPDPAPVDNFVIRFFNNVPGAAINLDTPEINPYVQLTPVGLTRVATGYFANPWMGDGGTVYEYTASLSVPQGFAADTHYWMSIVNNTGSDWGWFLDGDVTTGFGFLYGHFNRPQDGDNWTRYSLCTNTAYELRFDGTDIPEASTVALGAIGLLGIRGAFWRRKRR